LTSLPALRPDLVATIVSPTSTRTVVPLALNLATLLTSAQDAILLAANIGGDSDSVASIAGGILGAMYPQTVNREWIAVVEQVNRHDLLEVSRKLAAIRFGER
jgi:ADP-ribosylglycohydrolase